jgi:propanol-preferring alcohol dehydrogenase
MDHEQDKMKQEGTMLAMLLDEPRKPLREARVPIPVPQPHQVLIKVHACGVCRTDLHIVEGDLTMHKSPLILGHEIVGTIVQLGSEVKDLRIGERIGVPWLGCACMHCGYCASGHENLCNTARFTGYDIDGGYAEYAVADARYCFRIPAQYDDAHAAPLLCAGLIGYRAYAMTGNAQRIGLYGFGAAAHIIAQVARQQGREVYAFTRPGDTRSQEFALSLGARWAGDSNMQPPVLLDAAIIFASVGALVPQALSVTAKGATVVCAGIHMSDIPQFPYSLLWSERTVRSVANLTRADGEAFFALAAQMDIRTSPVVFSLQKANEALADLRAGRFEGAAVLIS